MCDGYKIRPLGLVYVFIHAEAALSLLLLIHRRCGLFITVSHGTQLPIKEVSEHIPVWMFNMVRVGAVKGFVMKPFS